MDVDALQSDRRPNSEAIAWYVEQAESLLDDLRERVQSLRTRGGQLAGFAALRWAGILFLIGLLAVSSALGILIFEVTLDG